MICWTLCYTIKLSMWLIYYLILSHVNQALTYRELLIIWPYMTLREKKAHVGLNKWHWGSQLWAGINRDVWLSLNQSTYRFSLFCSSSFSPWTSSVCYPASACCWQLLLPSTPNPVVSMVVDTLVSFLKSDVKKSEAKFY